MYRFVPLLLLLFTKSIFCQFHWSAYTYQEDIKKVVYWKGNLWGFTSGGIFKISQSDDSLEKITTLDGLSTNDCITALSGEGVIWAGMSDGTINTYNPESNNWEIIPIDPDRIVINELVFYNDNLFIATNLGVSEFLLAKNEIRSTFRNLGEFEINTEVNTLFIHDGTLWAGTNKGIAYAPVNSPNLQDPQYWKNYTRHDGMPDININDLEVYNSELYSAADIDVLSFNGFEWEREWVGYGKYTFLKVIGDALYTCGERGVFRKDTETGWTRVGSELKNATSIEKDLDGKFWASCSNNGLYALDEISGEWIKYSINSPGGNNFSEIAQDLNGILWAVSGGFENRGIYSFNNELWKNYTIEDGLISSSFFSVAVDGNNRKWFGTPGNGAMILEENGVLSITKIDTAGGMLSGSDTPSFVVVGDIKVDNSGNIWLINNFASNGRALVVISPDLTFHYFSLSDGLSSNELNKIEFDLNNNIWIATTRRGIDVLNINGTLDDKSDDNWTHITTSHGLHSNRIRALNTDKGGIVWIGTEEGVNYWYNGTIYNQYGLIDDYINAIEVDAVNNKWFATNSGISVLSNDNFSWTHFTKETSPLVDDQAMSLLALKSGTVYVGTAKGLSIIETPFIEPEQNLEDLSFYPNPFIPTGSGEKLVIEGLLLNAKIRIFTMNGVLVKELSEANGGIIGSRGYWDGRNEKGAYVSSGIYVLAAFTENGERKTGKLAVIRE